MGQIISLMDIIHFDHKDNNCYKMIYFKKRQTLQGNTNFRNYILEERFYKKSKVKTFNGANIKKKLSWRLWWHRWREASWCSTWPQQYLSLLLATHFFQLRFLVLYQNRSSQNDGGCCNNP